MTPLMPADPGGLRRRRRIAPAPAPLPPPAGRALRVGLLGGSFNPAHAGHRHLSLVALQRLGLDQVWWLVTPQNPLKSAVATAPLAARLAQARAVAAHPGLVVSAPETRFHTRYTVDTLARLQAAWPTHRFVWLMGADNLAQLPRWRRWEAIAARCPLAVVERQPWSYPALRGRAASRLAAARLPAAAAATLADRTPPAWVFLRVAPHPASSTAIRAAATPTNPGAAPSPA